MSVLCVNGIVRLCLLRQYSPHSQYLSNHPASLYIYQTTMILCNVLWGPTNTLLLVFDGCTAQNMHDLWHPGWMASKVSPLLIAHFTWAPALTFTEIFENVNMKLCSKKVLTHRCRKNCNISEFRRNARDKKNDGDATRERPGRGC